MQVLDPDFHVLRTFSLGPAFSLIRITLKRVGMPAHVADAQKLVPEDILSHDEIQAAAVWFKECGLPRSADILQDWADGAGSSKPIPETVYPELERSILRELRANLFLRVPEEKSKYFANNNLFGLEVAKAFPSAVYDIEEAGKSFSLARYTGCVFHLMRATEVALRVLARTLNDPRLDPKRNPSWDSILKKCREELEKERSKRAPEWAVDDVFFSGAAITLMGVKDAWRNPTLHVEINYDEERALDVWNHVRAFMRHLATKLSE